MELFILFLSLQGNATTLSYWQCQNSTVSCIVKGKRLEGGGAGRWRSRFHHNRAGGINFRCFFDRWSVKMRRKVMRK